jgi:hypothetical protein
MVISGNAFKPEDPDHSRDKNGIIYYDIKYKIDHLFKIIDFDFKSLAPENLPLLFGNQALWN